MWDRYTPEQKRQFLAGAASHVPLRRVAKPEEIGEVIIACMTSTYITGTVIPVDGGSTLA
jgi:NAD(P)-dependent dehydrogenase (short-subunit alcohol dehydrogenase family)